MTTRGKDKNTGEADKFMNYTVPSNI
jgi:hypothetical protein